MDELELSPGDLISIRNFRVLNVNVGGDRIYELGIYEEPKINSVGYTHWGSDQHVVFLVEKTSYQYNDFFTSPIMKHFYHEHQIWKVFSGERTYWAMFLSWDYNEIIKLNER